jgi:hypothetical protein
MRYLIPFAFVVSMLIAQSPSGGLTGRWRSTEVSPAGISALFEFREDNQLDSCASVISEEEYRVVGTDTIILKNNGREQKLELEWDNQNHARIDDESVGKKTELVRQGKTLDSKNPILGEWSTAREWRANLYPARAIFLASGKVVWITYIRIYHGHYSLKGENIDMEIDEHPIIKGPFTVSPDHLTLPSPRGGQSSFERF